MDTTLVVIVVGISDSNMKMIMMMIMIATPTMSQYQTLSSVEDERIREIVKHIQEELILLHHDEEKNTLDIYWCNIGQQLWI